MTNPFELLNERLDRLENLFINFTEKILKKEETESPNVKQPKLVKIDEAARITGYKKGYIYELIFRNAIPHIKRGRSIRFDPEELDAWMRSGRPHILNQTIKALKES